MTPRLALICLFAAATHALAADRLYLRLDAAPGESQQTGRINWIEASFFSHGALVARPGRIDGLRIVKRLDTSSPELLKRATMGQRISSGTLEIVRPTGSAQVRLLQLNLTNIAVVEILQSGNAEYAEEEVLLDFDVAEWVYTQIDPAGAPAGEVRASWNRVTGEGSGVDHTDTDADGMPLAYEQFYGLNPQANDAGADLDGDGATNLQEFRAGTIPNRKDSVFRVTGKRLAGGRIELDWIPVRGKTYKLLAAPAAEGPYTELGPLDPNANGRLVFDASRQRQFFIIESN